MLKEVIDTLKGGSRGMQAAGRVERVMKNNKIFTNTLYLQNKLEQTNLNLNIKLVICK